MEKHSSKIVFIVNAVKDIHKVARALNSISRQSNNEYEVVVASSFKKDELLCEVKNLKSFVHINNNKDFASLYCKEANSLPENYFLLTVNYDEIVAPNAVETLLNHKENDIIISNMAVAANNKYSPLYSVTKDLNIGDYLNRGAVIWNCCIRAGFIKKSGALLNNLSYLPQTLYLLHAIAAAKSIFLTNTVLYYRDILMKEKAVEYKDFSRNRKTISKILKVLKKKRDYEVLEYTVKKFVVPQLPKLYAETSFIKRIKKRLILIKYLGII